MPLKSYDKKIDHDLGIPLQDDYFYDDPEEIIENNSISEVDSKAKLQAKKKLRLQKSKIKSQKLKAN